MKKTLLKAALHVHSTYSDGEFTLAELRDIFSSAGCTVVCVTDHAEYFDEKKLQEYIQACASHCDSKFLFIPGLEYTCRQGMHILGYGTTALVGTRDPQQVIRHIKEHKGLAVIAHPADRMFSRIESFQELPTGIETWNSKYDGQYAPRTSTFALLQRLQNREPGILAFFGQDLHWKRQYRGLFTHVECDSLQRELVLQRLASGRYVGVKNNFQLPSSGVLDSSLIRSFERVHARSDRMRNFLRSGKKAMDGLGITVPASLKSRLRKIF